MILLKSEIKISYFYWTLATDDSERFDWFIVDSSISVHVVNCSDYPDNTVLYLYLYHSGFQWM